LRAAGSERSSGGTETAWLSPQWRMIARASPTVQYRLVGIGTPAGFTPRRPGSRISPPAWKGRGVQLPIDDRSRVNPARVRLGETSVSEAA
jgi:hypothetical protein